MQRSAFEIDGKPVWLLCGYPAHAWLAVRINEVETWLYYTNVDKLYEKLCAGGVKCGVSQIRPGSGLVELNPQEMMQGGQQKSAKILLDAMASCDQEWVIDDELASEIIAIEANQNLSFLSLLRNHQIIKETADA